jgi:hypothetical protein
VDGVTPFRRNLLEALRRRADTRNEVSGTFAELSEELGVSAGDVHTEMVFLNNDGFFAGTPHLDNESFNVRLPS